MNTTTEKPVRVTAHSPCEHCGRSDERCSRYADGVRSNCYRVPGHASVERQDSSGATYHAYGTKDRSEQVDASAEAGGVRPDRAKAEDLHKVYSALLKGLTLSGAHEQAMIARGFEAGRAASLGYRTLPSQGRDELIASLARKFSVGPLLSIPGFSANAQKKLKISALPGLMIPVRDCVGRIVAIVVRPDKGLSSGNKYLWLSSNKWNGPSSGSPVHVPSGLTSPVETIVVTEGQLKADLAFALSGIPTIGVPGVGNWRGSIPILKQLGARTARIAYDRDWKDKAEVARSLVLIAKGLQEAGFAVEVATWDDEPKGIDDLLAAGGSPRVVCGDDVKALLFEAGRIAEGLEAVAALDLVVRVRAKIQADGFAGLLRDKALIAELAKLRDDDPGEFGAIVVELKGVGKFPIREFNAAIGQAKPDASTVASIHPYHEKDGCLYVGQDRLANFAARIVEEVVRDDGSEEKKIEFRIEATWPGGREIVAEIKAEEFEPMKWVVANLGAMAILEAGRDTKSHVRAAIQYLSDDVARRTIFTHTGWRKIAGEWKYLHAGGAIGADGMDRSVTVELGGNLANFVLPDPPAGTERVRAIRASLEIIRLATPHRPSSRALAAVLLAAPYRAAICKVTTSLAFTGDSGAYKSSVAALAQQHFGAAMTKDRLPFNWSSTVNSLEADLHHAKDTLAVVDEFTMAGTANARAEMQSKADRIIRASADGHARGRLTKDGERQSPKPPRALMLSTGEDGFDRQSANARTLPIQFSKDRPTRDGTVDLEILTACQADARANLYAASMAAFLQWFAPRRDKCLDGFESKLAEYRGYAYCPGDHGRSPEAVADLFVGFEIFLEFAVEAKAISEFQAAKLKGQVWDGLKEASAEIRADLEDDGTPAERFIKILRSEMSSNRAHLIDTKTGQDPEGQESRCGWRRELKYQGRDEGQGYMWTQSRNMIGWVDEEYVYLIREAAYTVATKAIGPGDGIQLPGKNQLAKMLNSEGKLAKTDSRKDKNRFTSRVTLQGKQHDVLIIKATDVFGIEEETETEAELIREVEIGVAV